MLHIKMVIINFITNLRWIGFKYLLLLVIKPQSILSDKTLSNLYYHRHLITYEL